MRFDKPLYWKPGESSKMNCRNRKLWSIRAKNGVKRLKRKYPFLLKVTDNFSANCNLAAQGIKNIGIALREMAEDKIVLTADSGGGSL